MPSGTNVRQLMKDLAERRSRVTRAFEDLFGNRAALDIVKDAMNAWETTHPGSHPLRGGMATGPLPSWVSDVLMKRPNDDLPLAVNPINEALSNSDIKHVGDWNHAWSSGLLDDVRGVIAAAIDNPNHQGLNFVWELTTGPNEETVPSDTEVVFRSPYTRAEINGIAPPSRVLNARFKVGPGP